MTEPRGNFESHLTRNSRNLLEKISEILDVPIQTFTQDDFPSDELAELSELINLWTKIDKKEGRRALIDHARRLTSC